MKDYYFSVTATLLSQIAQTNACVSVFVVFVVYLYCHLSCNPPPAPNLALFDFNRRSNRTFTPCVTLLTSPPLKID